MKLFICSDLHGSRKSLLGINKFLDSHQMDGVCMLGDLCLSIDPNAERYAHSFIKNIKDRQLPLFAIHGNQEPQTVRFLYQANDCSVHFNPRKIGEYEIVGVGSGSVFPRDKSFAEGKIFLTHEPPPYKVLQKIKNRKSIPHSPLVHLAGHLHKRAYVMKLGETIFAQIPAAEDMRAAVLTLPERKISFISLTVGI